MFTGIVEELGRVNSLRGSRLRIDAEVVLHDVVMGASIAVNGCCLTVVATGSDDGSGSWWEADVSDETFRRTSLGTLTAGDPVNLERPVRLADRLGGHLVQGHVDAVAKVLQPAPDLRVELPDGLARYVVAKGSVTVDGVSLTVVDAAADSFHQTEITTPLGFGESPDLGTRLLNGYQGCIDVSSACDLRLDGIGLDGLIGADRHRYTQ